jgi:SAM-dependent methyltransferase
VLNASPSAAVAVLGEQPDPFGRQIAARMGSRGVVYSIELTEEDAPEPAQRPLLGHVKLRHRDTDRLPLPDASIDLVVWAFAFRTLGHLGSMLAEARRVLRPGGRFAIADWIIQDETVGPSLEGRVSAAACERCLAASGFGLLGQLMLNASHYLVLGRRPLSEVSTSVQVTRDGLLPI